jgi:hypothetical protein
MGRGARALRPVRPAGEGMAGDATAALAAVADVLLLVAYPWFLMGAFHSLMALTLKAAYAAAAVAALGAGNDLAVRRGGVPPARVRRRLLALALLMAATAAALDLLPAGTALEALAVALSAFVAGYLAGGVRPLPARSFPFSPRLPVADSVARLDLSAFAAVLAMLLLTATGGTAAFALLALLYAAIAVVGQPEGAREAAASARLLAAPPDRPLPPPLEALAAWAHRVVLGEAGIRRSVAVSDAVTVAFQVLFALAVYKIVVHMEFTALALGLLVASGAAGELAAQAIAPYLTSERNAALAVVASGLWTIGMFAGLAGSAFPPLEFVFWAGAAAGAAGADMGRARLALLARGPGPAAASPLLGPARLAVMVFAGYLVWWLSTFIAKPHSINLVLTFAGVGVGAAAVWVVLPAAVGKADAVPHAAQRRHGSAAR